MAGRRAAFVGRRDSLPCKIRKRTRAYTIFKRLQKHINVFLMIDRRPCMVSCLPEGKKKTYKS